MGDRTALEPSEG